jgi:hypothetical protein
MSGAAIFLQQFYAYISTFDGNKKDFWDQTYNTDSTASYIRLAEKLMLSS